MNSLLLNPYDQELPAVIDDCLDDHCIVSCRFNRRGTLIAAGTQDGRILVFDVECRTKVLTFYGHVQGISTLCWSRNGRYLVSGSYDWCVIVWDIVERDRVYTLRTDGCVGGVKFIGDDELVVCVEESWPVLVDWRKGEEVAKLHDAAAAITDTPSNCCVDASDDRIFIGTNKGQLLVFGKQAELLNSIRVSASPIRQLLVHRNGRFVAANSNDRVIRYYSIENMELIHKFQDLVNRIQWTCFNYNWTCEYIIAGASADHKLYVWDLSRGGLYKILDGPKDAVEDIQCHPLRPLVATVSSYGLIYLWTRNQEENWSAFAPGFKELETNTEYEEKEDEFDVVEVISRLKLEEEDVDVELIERIKPFGDEWEYDDDVLNVPLTTEDFVSDEEEIQSPVVQKTVKKSVAKKAKKKKRVK